MSPVIRRNLIACLTLGLCVCLSFGPGPVESRTRPKNQVDRKLLTIYGSTPHVEALLGPGRPTPDTYKTLRSAFFRYEESRSLGHDLDLNSREIKANETIMKAKLKEFDEGLVTPHLFKPSQHIFDVLDGIRNTDLFKLLKKMPKGAVLHAHDTALCSTAAIINLTYYEHLWSCQQDGDLSASALRFSKDKPQALSDCDWSLLSDVRAKYGADKVDDYLAERLTLYPTKKFEDNNAAWSTFMSIFNLLDGLVMYAPVWADYYYKALEEFYEDGVLYLEFRSVVPTLYDMDGTEFTPMDTVRIYVETLEKFKEAHPDFIGSRMIYAPIRYTNAEGVTGYIQTLKQIKEKYPEFVAGFDLVGQEEMGRPLRDFVDELLSIPDDIDFYFHAGETNWFGSTVDENLIDAILLGTKRIGHGFGLVKHPVVLDMLKKLNVAIEVNPISNQVLQLVSDFRNHPCSHFFADGYPVVISSDDPSFWKATPLTHDFYIAFLGIASQHSDLRLLKKLALNSIQYSSLTGDAQFEALEKWQVKWDQFIADVNDRSSNRGSPSQRID
uniref:Adenosine deaminase n=1 Tax=Drosophila melanogaster TaxID=7227 RepID=Q9VVK5_DROME|nr:adenosine deaminase-related growth factor A, isoform A [Drosophila melanogaster]NP_996119.1 adenosine deaminase-related growth factor A, isoform B [Drosophila melanogaster]AOQ11249.1 Adgf-A-RA [synthetic construct]AAF49306.1 adenosine deaminase-related growth factor A, isoform A [Drosophila melanogaster]AAL13884.1 LD35474p [Drosophila melanogaster]AAL40913.1 adenosine deaminase-related growth factor A [Drosophila melanogaster]AAS64976.1 adenosine deaminase-related growth factor A, isoform |eukprot:NP_524130.1 adenosine deaminase-related growth factor A, isoform A [Drosophila melanogaster]